MLIYIIRHGQTSWNKERRLQGRSNTVLNENGRALAARTAEGMKDIPFDLAFTSPLARAKETAEIILRDRDIPLIEDERLIELDFGEYEGMHWTSADANFFENPALYTPAPRGESFAHLAERTKNFMEDICSHAELADKTILVSTHGAAGRGLLNSMRSYEMSDFWDKGVAPNCGVAIVKCTNGKPILMQENITYYENV